MRIAAAGFTLIELSIVLVIIGLLVGGVLVGQDLIGAAQTRAEIAQIEKYNTAANTFKVKYSYLPGDIPDPYASNFGFQSRGGHQGEGDGNGLLEDYFGTGGHVGFTGLGGSGGETAVFWVDLGAAGLLDVGLTAATETANESGPNDITWQLAMYLPPAKIGAANYLYVWSGGLSEIPNNGLNAVGNGNNYFGLAAVTDLGYGVRGSSGLTVAQAYNIDRKTDDGLPQNGRITAFYNNWNAGGASVIWAAAGSGTGAADTSATVGSTATFFDNGNVAGVAQQYSMEQSNGSGVNCALSFQMQGAAR